jgi:hypothetical protein
LIRKMLILITISKKSITERVSSLD